METICTLDEVGDFPHDSELTTRINDKMYNNGYHRSPLTLAQARKEVRKEFNQELENQIPPKGRKQIAGVLTKLQSKALALLKRKGFRPIATYDGYEGHMTILLRGVKFVKS